jgi:hypothetical protein
MYGLKAGTNGPFVTTYGYRSQTDKPLAGITRGSATSKTASFAAECRIVR